MQIDCSAQGYTEKVDSIGLFDRNPLHELGIACNARNMVLLNSLEPLPSKGIKRLELDTFFIEPEYTEIFSGFEKLAFKKKIENYKFIHALIPNIKDSIQELSFTEQYLEVNLLGSFALCTKLKKIAIYNQKNALYIVEKLVSAIPSSIEEFEFEARSLNKAVAQIFIKFTTIKRLVIGGFTQNEEFCVELFSSLPDTLEELAIKAGKLSISTILKLQKFPKL